MLALLHHLIGYKQSPAQSRETSVCSGQAEENGQIGAGGAGGRRAGPAPAMSAPIENGLAAPIPLLPDVP